MYKSDILLQNKGLNFDSKEYSALKKVESILSYERIMFRSVYISQYSSGYINIPAYNLILDPKLMGIDQINNSRKKAAQIFNGAKLKITINVNTDEATNNNYRYSEELPFSRILADKLTDLLETRCIDSNVSKKINLSVKPFPLMYALGQPMKAGKREFGELIQKRMDNTIEAASLNLVLRLKCSRYHRPYLYIDDNENPIKLIIITKSRMASINLFST